MIEVTKGLYISWLRTEADRVEAYQSVDGDGKGWDRNARLFDLVRSIVKTVDPNIRVTRYTYIEFIEDEATRIEAFKSNSGSDNGWDRAAILFHAVRATIHAEQMARQAYHTARDPRPKHHDDAQWLVDGGWSGKQ
jgi:hypothetical protein